jgi:hypothetical protein
MPSSLAPFRLSPRGALLTLSCVALVCVAGCSRPKTDDLALLDASTDTTLDSHVVDAPEVEDVNLCEVGGGSPFRVCDGVCTNILTDRLRCGRCDRECAPDETCQNGSCVFTCSPGLVACRNRCIDPNTNPDFCGARDNCSGANAGSVCMGGQSCVAGRCQFVCPPGQIACGGNCIDPMINPQFCGATGDCEGSNRGRNCPSGQICAMGGCRCPTGFVSCGGTCIDPNTNTRFCGATGDCQMSNAGRTCASGELCVGGTCGTTCGTGTILCGESCVDPLSNSRYCGARADCAGPNAGRTCTTSELCINGTCTYFEPPQSWSSLAIDEPFEATVTSYRAIDVTIGSVIPSTILYTCNGSAPTTAGMGGTMSATNVAIVTVGAATCPTVRWVADYGPPLGRERVIHSRTVRVSAPATIERSDVGTIIDRVTINGRGPVALLAPGQPYTLEFNQQWWTSGSSGACPGCIVQSNVTVESDMPGGFQPLNCELYGFGLTFPGRFAARRHMLNAPTRPGRYALRAHWTWQFTCGPSGAWPGGAPVGYIVVQ